MALDHAQILVRASPSYVKKLCLTSESGGGLFLFDSVDEWDSLNDVGK